MERADLLCGCTIEYELDNVGDYGYGGEIVDRWELKTGRIINTCPYHTPKPSTPWPPGPFQANA